MMQTPYYEIEEQKLNEDIALLKGALESGWGKHSVAACSVKTNSLPWLLNHFRQNGFWAEVVSAEEYDLAMRIGFAPDKVIYNGPIKDRCVFEKVLSDGGLVNLDSSMEPEWLSEMAQERRGEESLRFGESQGGRGGKGSGRSLRVGLRVNVDFRKLVPSEVPAEEAGLATARRTEALRP